MPHDPTKFKMGTTNSSAKDVSNFKSDPATFPAGTAVRVKSDGKLSVTAADGGFAGVSLGAPLSDAKVTTVVRTGEGVAVLLTDDAASYAYVVLGASVYIDDVSGKADVTSGSTLTNAIYVSLPLDGVLENGTTAKVALIDMPGGL